MTTATDSIIQGHNIQASQPTAASLFGMTPRQTEASVWVAEGKTDEEIGLIMACTPRTAKAHVQDAMRRTDTHCRAQLVAALFLREIFEACIHGNVAARMCMMFVMLTLGTLFVDDSTELAPMRTQRRPVAGSQVVRHYRGDHYAA